MSERFDTNILLAIKKESNDMKSLEGQKRRLNPRDPNYKKRVKEIEDKIRRLIHGGNKTNGD
jgi:hypothetical protein